MGLSGMLIVVEVEGWLSPITRLLSLNTHQLRDERRPGRIKASVGLGRRILYRRENQIEYLTSRLWRS
jgi:hypothetical protein